MQQIPDMGKLIRLAQTPAGQQLIALLQKQGGSRLQQAIESAGGGDYAKAKAVFSELLSTPEAQVLLRELEGRK